MGVINNARGVVCEAVLLARAVWLMLVGGVWPDMKMGCGIMLS